MAEIFSRAAGHTIFTNSHEFAGSAGDFLQFGGPNG
jgi:hypothetical protein